MGPVGTGDWGLGLGLDNTLCSLYKHSHFRINLFLAKVFYFVLSEPKTKHITHNSNDIVRISINEFEVANLVDK